MGIIYASTKSVLQYNAFKTSAKTHNFALTHCPRFCCCCIFLGLNLEAEEASVATIDTVRARGPGDHATTHRVADAAYQHQARSLGAYATDNAERKTPGGWVFVGCNKCLHKHFLTTT